MSDILKSYNLKREKGIVMRLTTPLFIPLLNIITKLLILDVRTVQKFQDPSSYAESESHPKKLGLVDQLIRQQTSQAKNPPGFCDHFLTKSPSRSNPPFIRPFSNKITENHHPCFLAIFLQTHPLVEFASRMSNVCYKLLLESECLKKMPENVGGDFL